MGGMKTLQWAASYRIVFSRPFTSRARPVQSEHSAPRGRTSGDHGRPDWRGGWYLEEEKAPNGVWQIARMAAHITYLSERAMHRKFGRHTQDRETLAHALTPISRWKAIFVTRGPVSSRG